MLHNAQMHNDQRNKRKENKGKEMGNNAPQVDVIHELAENWPEEKKEGRENGEDAEIFELPLNSNSYCHGPVVHLQHGTIGVAGYHPSSFCTCNVTSGDAISCLWNARKPFSDRGSTANPDGVLTNLTIHPNPLVGGEGVDDW